MTLNSTLIADAYRESNFTGQGATLSDDEQSEGLSLLQSLAHSFYGLVIGQRFAPWWVPSPNYTAPTLHQYPATHSTFENRSDENDSFPPANSRVILRNSAPKDIYFQAQPEDGAMMQIVDAGFTADVTLHGNGHFIGETGVDTTEVLTTAVGGGSRVPTKTYVFRADMASWNAVDTLVYGGEMPFPDEFDDYWVTALAIRLSARFGNDPRAVTLMRHKEVVTFIRGWYRQTSPVLVGDAGTPSYQSYNPIAYTGNPDQGSI